MTFSGKGLAIAPLGGWGNLRYSANAAFMMVLAAKHTNDSAVRSASLSWAQTQVDYMLGLKGSARWAHFKPSLMVQAHSCIAWMSCVDILPCDTHFSVSPASHSSCHCRSFVVGYGTNPPTHEHHRAASCSDRPAACGWDAYNSAASDPQRLAGALVGGPADSSDAYTDARNNYQCNEPALDYNAGFTGVLAGLIQLLA